MVNQKKEPDPERWKTRISAPLPAIEMFHPAPFTEGLLESASLPVWVETPIACSMQGAGTAGKGRAKRK